MNLPNYITLLRVILIPFFIDFMIYGYYLEALLVFAAACITDALDGLIARVMEKKTELGAFLDPLADKLLILSTFVTLAVLGKLPFWLVIIVLSRDAILTMGSIVIYFTTQNLKIRPSLLGKMATVMQLLVVAMTLVLMNFTVSVQFMPVLYWTTAAITIASGLQYVMRGVKLVG